MKRYIKLIKTYLKPLKGDQRKNFTQENCKSLKVMRKKSMECYERDTIGKCTTKSSTLPTKITVNETDIFDTKK